MKLFAVLALTVLTACGAAGEPERPAAGLTVSGEARVGAGGTL